ncbi:MAG: hypothetical protein ACP5TL_01515 [Candidatus Micrarchaeia archaeon]
MESKNTSENSRLERLNRVYLAIILRYKDIIEEKESISVAELPTLITPKDPQIIEKAEEIKKDFPNYIYDRDFYEASKKAFEFVKSQIQDIVLPVQFWLDPSETLNFQVGDLMDKNVLLCSLLISLGNPSAKVLVEVDNAMTVFVYFGYLNAYYLMDIKGGIKKFNSKEEIYESVITGEDSAAYEFNNQSYSDIK